MIRKEWTRIFCLVFGLGLSLGLSAQDEQKPLQVDIHAGVTGAFLQNAHAGQSATTGIKAGFTMGAGLQINLSKKFALVPELNYEGLGGGHDTHLLPNMPLQGYNRYSFHYYTIPIFLKYFLPVEGLGIFAGPQYGHRLSAKLDYGQGFTEEADGLGKADWAGVVGAEYYKTLAKGFAMGVSGRYQMGFNNIYSDPVNDYSLKNRAFLLTIGCRF